MRAVLDGVGQYLADARKVQASNREITNSVRSVEASARTAGASASRLGGLIASSAKIGALAVAAMGAATVYSGIKMSISLEKAQLQFQILLGSADAAKAHVKDLFTFAAKTPFETGPIIEASRLMLGAGIAVSSVEEHLTRAGDAAAIAGVEINEVGRWYARAYAAIQAGRPFGVAAERLAELTILTPKARNKLEDLQKTGASTTEIWAAFTAEFEKFTGAMPLMAGTWEGLMSTIKDNVGIVMSTALKPLFDLIKSLMNQAAEFVQGARFEEWAQGVSQSLEGAMSAFRRVGGFIRDFVSAVLAIKNLGEGPILDFSGIDAERALAKLPGWLQPIAETLGMVIDKFREFFRTLRGQGDEVGTFISSLMKIAAPVGLLVQALLPPLIDFLLEMANVFVALATEIGPPLANLLEIVGKSFNDIGTGVLPPLLNALKPVLTTMAGIAVVVLPPLINGLAALVDVLARTHILTAILAAVLARMMIIKLAEFLVYGGMWLAQTIMQTIALAQLVVAELAAVAPLLLLAAAVAALVVGLVLLIKNWGTVQAAMVSFGTSALRIAGSIASSVVGAFGGMAAALLRLGGQAISAIGRGMAAAARGTFQVAAAIVRGLVRILNPFMWVFGSDIVDVYTAAGKEASDALVAALHRGLSRVEVVADVLVEPLKAMRQVVADLHDEMQRLLGLPTRESAAEELELANKRLEAFNLELQAQEERERREKIIARLREQMADATDEDRAALEDRIDTLEDERGPAERQLDNINEQITALERLAEGRGLERDILAARGQVADQTLATDSAVMQSMQALIPVIDSVTGTLNTQTANIHTLFIPAWQELEEETKGAAEGAAGGVDDMATGMEEALGGVEEQVAETQAELDKRLKEIEEMEIEFDPFKSFKEPFQEAGLDTIGETVRRFFGDLFDPSVQRDIAEFYGMPTQVGDTLSRITGIFEAKDPDLQEAITKPWAKGTETVKFLVGHSNFMVPLQDDLEKVQSGAGRIFGNMSETVMRITGEMVRGVVSAIAGLPGTIASFAGSFFSGAATLGSSLASGLLDGILGIVQGPSFAGNMATALRRAVTMAWNAMIRWADNNLMFSFTTPDKVAGIPLGPFGGKTIEFDPPLSPFLIPEFARGGIVRQATLALIGEAGPEAVVPLQHGGISGLDSLSVAIENAMRSALGDLAHFFQTMVGNLTSALGQFMSAPTQEGADTALAIAELRRKAFDAELAADVERSARLEAIADQEKMIASIRETAATRVAELEDALGTLRERNALEEEAIQENISELEEQAALFGSELTSKFQEAAKKAKQFNVLEMKALADRIAKEKHALAMQEAANDTEELAAQTEIERVQTVADAEEAFANQRIAGLEAQRGANEKSVASINEQIAALERVQERRQLERDIIVAQGEAANQLLLTEQQVFAFAQNIVAELERTSGLYFDLNTQLNDLLERFQEGIQPAAFAAILAQQGFGNIATAILEAIAEGNSFQHGGVITGSGAVAAVLHPPEAIIPLRQGLDLTPLASLLGGNNSGGFRNYGNQYFLTYADEESRTMREMREALGG